MEPEAEAVMGPGPARAAAGPGTERRPDELSPLRRRSASERAQHVAAAAAEVVATVAAESAGAELLEVQRQIGHWEQRQAAAAAAAGGGGGGIGARLTGGQSPLARQRSPLPRLPDLGAGATAFDDPADPGFTQSFGLHELPAAAAFFEDYGMVVVREVLSAREVAATTAEIFGEIAADSPGFDAGDASTWRAFRSRSFGQPRGAGPTVSPQISANRLSPAVYATFAALTGERELLASMDRWCRSHGRVCH
jgi:hypothetical protein